MNAISMSLALTMAGAPKPPSRTSSLRTPVSWTERPDSEIPRDFSVYKGISNRPLGWKVRRPFKNPTLGSTARDMAVKRWNGAARSSTDWDGLKRDPELWYSQGNCLVHLYGQGQSRRGPAFRLPMEGLLAANCRPLLDRFLAQNLEESPISDADSFENKSYFLQRPSKTYELYIPAPADADRGEAFLYHLATRNFFAWVFGKSLVGNHLGSALVSLLNSMTQFRSPGEENIDAIMDYMDEEGYADMRNSPDHALAVLYFAEHFHFKDLWIDAFAHCTGMNERLISSPGFEFMSRTSRALVTRSRFEMDVRLESCGKRLGSFLSDDLSETYLGLSSGARSHLDKFRSFLQSYFVLKLGYFPPTSGDTCSAAFPKNVYGQMCNEFQKLYEYLVDSQFNSSDPTRTPQQGGICVLQSLQAFDQRHKYPSLPHQLPLLPEAAECASSQRPIINRRFSFASKADKMKPDPRLVTLSSLTKATNRTDQSLLECTLVRAYRGFEKDCVFSTSKADKQEKLSLADARKVRWILIYATLQTLLSATKAPDEVRDINNVSYNICVLTAGCPPWKEQRPIETLLRTQTDQMRTDFAIALTKPEIEPTLPLEITPDIDYVAVSRRQSQHVRGPSDSSVNSTFSKKSTVRKALEALGNMPELRHPRPQRASFHEILIHGYGNGLNTVNITSDSTIDGENSSRKVSSDSGSENLSSRWSHASSIDTGDVGSPATSVYSESRRGSDSSEVSKKLIKEFLDTGRRSVLGLVRVPSSIYSESAYEESILQPDPLSLKRNSEQEYLKVTTEVKVEWEEGLNGKANDELLAYLDV